MTAPQRRATTRRSIPKRRPLNLNTLQMMVQSGVVRRADFDPPTFERKTRFHVLEDVDRNSVKEVGSEQGWLARVVLGRKWHSPVSKRS